jgi:hypothetical protein
VLNAISKIFSEKKKRYQIRTIGLPARANVSIRARGIAKSNLANLNAARK